MKVKGTNRNLNIRYDFMARYYHNCTFFEEGFV